MLTDDACPNEGDRRPDPRNDPVTGLLATSYHEAGHAIVAHMVGIRFSHVSVIPNGSGFGRVMFVDIPYRVIDNSPGSIEAPLERREAARWLMALLAGPVAEQVMTPPVSPCSPLSWADACRGGDRDGAANCAAWVWPGSDDLQAAGIVFVRERLRVLLNMDAVYRATFHIANDLILEGELRPRHIRAIARRCNVPRFGRYVLRL